MLSGKTALKNKSWNNTNRQNDMRRAGNST